MIETLKGDVFVSPGQRFALVVAEFNNFITTQLAAGAVDCLLRHGARESQITQVNVPGSFEIPTVAMALAKSRKYAAVICLGAVIKGETGHYDHVASAVSSGVAAIGPATGVPTLFGVLTTDTLEQAIDRSGGKAGNIGYNAALAAISTVSVLDKLKEAK